MLTTHWKWFLPTAFFLTRTFPRAASAKWKIPVSFQKTHWGLRWLCGTAPLCETSWEGIKAAAELLTLGMTPWRISTAFQHHQNGTNPSAIFLLTQILPVLPSEHPTFTTTYTSRDISQGIAACQREQALRHGPEAAPTILLELCGFSKIKPKNKNHTSKQREKAELKIFCWKIIGNWIAQRLHHFWQSAHLAVLFLRNSPSTGPNLYHGAGVTTDKVDNPKIKGKEWKISQQCKNRVSTSVIEWVGYCILFLLRTGCPWRKESWNPNAAEMHGLNAGLKSFQSLLACRADPKPDLSWHSLSTKHSSCTWTNPIKAIGFAEKLQAARSAFQCLPCCPPPHP